MFISREEKGILLCSLQTYLMNCYNDLDKQKDDFAYLIKVKGEDKYKNELKELIKETKDEIKKINILFEKIFQIKS